MSLLETLILELQSFGSAVEINDNNDNNNKNNDTTTNNNNITTTTIKEASKIKETLQSLLVDIPSKEDILKTKAGLLLNRHRKLLPEGEEKDLVTKVLTTWKGVLVGGGGGISGVGAEKNITVDAEKNITKETNNITSKNITSKNNEQNNNDKENSIATLYEKLLLNDEVRDKCFTLLVAALTQNQKAKERKPYWGADQLLLETARAIEVELHGQSANDLTKYKQEFRSKYLNLKETRNASLREGLLGGSVGVEEFVRMSPSQMANPARKRLNDLLIKENLREAQASTDNDAETDQFKCGRCGKRKAKYYQLQTRSADEPMTTFVTCVNCGNRWRF